MLRKVLQSTFFKTSLAVIVLVALAVMGRFNLGDIALVGQRIHLVVIAFMLMVPTYFLVSLRFGLVLELFELKSRMRDATRWTMIGSFCDTFMPSSSGGDIVKIGYVASHFGPGFRTRSTLAVLYDRVVGLFGLFILSAMSFVVGFGVVSKIPNYMVVGALVLTACAGGILLFFILTWKRVAHSRRLGLILKRLPFGDKVSLALQILSATKHAGSKLGLILLLSVGNHLLWSSALLVVTYAFGASVDPVVALSVFPIGVFLGFFGFAGGFGVGTAAFDVIFQVLLGISNGATIALLYQGLGFLSRLLGLPFFVFGRIAARGRDATKD